jgi:cytochrome c oxidase assembly factor CtaG
LRNLSGIAALAVVTLLSVSLVMTRIPPPHYFDDMNIAHVLLGFDLQEAPDWMGLFFVWRPNVIFLVLGITAIVLYLRGVRILRKRGDRWPVNRTVAWVAGWLVAIFLTCSGYGKYSAASFSIHMIVHMGLNMVVPILLVLGGVITLTLRASKPTKAKEPAGLHDWLTQALNWPVLRFIYNPLLVFLTFVGSYYMLYLTDLFGEAMRFHWAHQFMNLHFMIIGYLFYSLVIGVDRPPRPLPPLGKLGFVLAAMPFHAFFGVVLMTTETTIAENFSTLVAGWPGPAEKSRCCWWLLCWSPSGPNKTTKRPNAKTVTMTADSMMNTRPTTKCWNSSQAAAKSSPQPPVPPQAQSAAQSSPSSPRTRPTEPSHEHQPRYPPFQPADPERGAVKR